MPDKMRNKEEEHLQKDCILWFDYQYPTFQKLLFAVPNGGSRNLLEAVNLKKQGVRAGISDMIFLYPSYRFAFLCIEFKTIKGKQSDEQKQFETLIDGQTQGRYVVIRSFEEFKEIIEDHIVN